MRTAILASCLALITGAAAAQDARFRFLWQGAGDYTMRGALSFPADLLSQGVIHETDLSCFEIEGFLGAAPVGRWALGLLGPETSWTLTFDPAVSAFLVYGSGAAMPQAWNMDGAGYNCGPGGFGFNIGNAAQDLCIDGQLIFDSQVDPSQPFPAVRDDTLVFGENACRPEMLLGQAPENKAFPTPPLDLGQDPA